MSTELRYCPQCEATRPVAEFRASARYKGRAYLHRICRLCETVNDRKATTTPTREQVAQIADKITELWPGWLPGQIRAGETVATATCSLLEHLHYLDSHR